MKPQLLNAPFRPFPGWNIAWAASTTAWENGTGQKTTTSQTLKTLQPATDDALRASIYADWSLTSHKQGKEDVANAMATESLELAERISDPGVLAQSHNIVGILAASQNDYNRAQNASQSQP